MYASHYYSPIFGFLKHQGEGSMSYSLGCTAWLFAQLYTAERHHQVMWPFYASYMLRYGRLPGFPKYIRYDPAQVVRVVCESVGESKTLYAEILASVFCDLAEFHDVGHQHFSLKDAEPLSRDTYLRGLVDVLHYLQEYSPQLRERIHETCARLQWQELSLSTVRVVMTHAVAERSAS